jgi:hypothetical protein
MGKDGQGEAHRMHFVPSGNAPAPTNQPFFAALDVGRIP